MTITALKRGQNGTRHINDRIPVSGSTPANMVASQGTLTIAEAVTADDTMTIGHKVYTFVADGTAIVDGEIDMGANEAATKLAIVTAILGTDGVNFPNNHVTCAAAFSTDDLVLTAINGGPGGDLLATTETFTHATNVFDDGTLGTTTAGAGDPAATVGSFLVDATHLYICIAATQATNTWRRVAHSALA